MNAATRVSGVIACAAVAAGVVLSGCGIGGTEAVEELQPEELAALDQTTTSTTTTTVEIAIATEPEDTTPESVETMPPQAAVETSVAIAVTDVPTSTTIPTETVTLYFVEGSRLLAVDVEVPAPAELRRQLIALGAGPPPAEFSAGVRTAVPADLVNRVTRWPNGITVDLNSEPFNGVESEDQRIMVAQIVLTLTVQPGIDEVLFTIDGEALRVYRRDNVLSEPGEPVTSEDYEELLADGQPSNGT